MEKEFVELLDECYMPFNSNKVCDKVKDILISYSMHHNDIYEYFDYLKELDKILSPIEQIFYVSYVLYCSFFDEAEVDGVPIMFLLLENINSQEKIKFGNKTYNADFVIDFSNKKEWIPKVVNNLKYVVELDGFDYHSNKEQMNYDYERENNLKLKGYNVIRFTGSQLYKEPFNCVDNLIRIIVKDIIMETNKKHE